MAKTEDTRSKKGKLPESRQKRANKRLISNLLIWILVCGILSAGFFIIQDVTDTGSRLVRYVRDGGRDWTGGWAAGLSIFTTILGFNLATTEVLIHYVRQHERNVVSWTTASLVFTPILSSVVYLLTWPKARKLTGLE